MRIQSSTELDLENAVQIRSFRDLIVWQRAMQLCIAVYELTRDFPHEELHGLSAQMRRAAVSVISKIAEGHGRDSLDHLIEFLAVARGASFELEAQLNLARELRYGSAHRMALCDDLCNQVERMLNAMLTSLKGTQFSEIAAQEETAASAL